MSASGQPRGPTGALRMDDAIFRRKGQDQPEPAREHREGPNGTERAHSNELAHPTDFLGLE